MKNNSMYLKHQRFIFLMISLAFVFVLSSCNSQKNSESKKQSVSIEQKKRPTKNKLKKNDNDKDSIDNIESYIVELEQESVDDKGYVKKEDAEVLVNVFYEEAKKAQKVKVFKNVEKGVFSVYLELNSGVGFVYLPKIKGVKSGGVEAPKIYSYNLTDEDPKNIDKSIGSFLENTKEKSDSIAEWKKYSKPDFTESSLKDLNDNNSKIVLIDSHGGYTDSLGSFLLTNIEYDEKKHGTDVVISQDNNLVLYSDSFDKLLSKNSLNNSLVILNACNSALDMINPVAQKKLIEVLLDKGASAVVGYNRVVEDKYTDYVNDKLLKNLSTYDKNKGYMTLQEALNKAINSHEDEEIDKTIVDIYGNKDYSLGKYVDYKTMYDDIIRNIEKQDYGNGLDATGDYMYSFINMNSDKIPELLIAADDATGISHVKIFSFNEKTGMLTRFSDVFASGVAKGGGFRGQIYASKKNNGMIHISFTSVSAEAEAYRYTMNGDKFNMEALGTFKMPNIPKDLQDEIIDIEWISAKDGSSHKREITEEHQEEKIKEVYKEEVEEEVKEDTEVDVKEEVKDVSKEEANESMSKESNQQAIDADPIILDGKIELLSNDDLLSMENKEGMIKEFGGSKLNPIFILNEPQAFNFKLETGSDIELKKTDKIIVGNLGQLKDYDGKTVKIKIDPEKTYWPADSKSPLNHPTTKEYEIIK